MWFLAGGKGVLVTGWVGGCESYFPSVGISFVPKLLNVARTLISLSFNTPVHIAAATSQDPSGVHFMMVRAQDKDTAAERVNHYKLCCASSAHTTPAFYCCMRCYVLKCLQCEIFVREHRNAFELLIRREESRLLSPQTATVYLSFSWAPFANSPARHLSRDSLVSENLPVSPLNKPFLLAADVTSCHCRKRTHVTNSVNGGSSVGTTKLFVFGAGCQLTTHCLTKKLTKISNMWLTLSKGPLETGKSRDERGE